MRNVLKANQTRYEHLQKPEDAIKAGTVWCRLCLRYVPIVMAAVSERGTLLYHCIPCNAEHEARIEAHALRIRTELKRRRLYQCDT